MILEATTYLIDKIGDERVVVEKNDNDTWFLLKRNAISGLEIFISDKCFKTPIQAAAFYGDTVHGQTSPKRVKSTPITLEDKKLVIKYLLRRTNVCTTIEDHEILVLKAIQKELK